VASWLVANSRVIELQPKAVPFLQELSAILEV
jgi:hypothetical protein